MSAEFIEPSPANFALKRACAEAVRLAGGPSFVAPRVKRAPSRISEWANAKHPDFMPLNIVHQVEALAGAAPITAELARLAGIPLPDADFADAAPVQASDHLSRIAIESSDLIRGLAERVKRRGAMSFNQRKDLLSDVDQLLDVVMRLHCDLTRDDGEASGE